jgi:hypothetical protein
MNAAIAELVKLLARVAVQDYLAELEAEQMAEMVDLSTDEEGPQVEAVEDRQ